MGLETLAQGDEGRGSLSCFFGGTAVLSDDRSIGAWLEKRNVVRQGISLYCDSFKGSLSSMMSSVQGQWSHSLIDRNEGLRQVARSYDSALFDRFAENVIRSIRFGTSMSDSLSLLAVEARAIRKAKLEERVAKAPVKMLLPVGTLILPAMLILVMGPIMLDLMKGF